MCQLVIMVAYFCHHLSDNYVDLSDLNVDLSVVRSLCRLVRKISPQQEA